MFYGFYKAFKACNGGLCKLCASLVVDMLRLPFCNLCTRDISGQGFGGMYCILFILKLVELKLIDLTVSNKFKCSLCC